MKEIRDEIKISLIVLFVLVVISGLTWFGYRQPHVTADVESGIDSSRMLSDLEVIGAEPSPVGSMEHTQVKEYLYNTLLTLGVNPEIQEASVINPYWRTGGTINNIVARIPGKQSNRAILLVAEYDTLATSPGVNTNKAAVVNILEVVRAVLTRGQLENDLIILLADGAEIGSLGALAFVEEHPWMSDVALVIYPEARGMSGSSILFGTSSRNGWLIDQYSKAVNKPIGNSFIYEIYRMMNNDNSFAILNQAEVPGFNLAYLEQPRYYHSAFDNLDNVELGSVQNQAYHLWQLVNHFGNQELLDIAEIDRVYFDLFGLKLVHYPITWVAHLITITLILFGFVTWQGFKRTRFRLKGVAYGLLALMLSGLLSGVLMSFVAGLFTPNHPLYQYIPLNNGSWYLIGISAFTATLFVLLYSFLFKKVELLDLTFGAQIIWLIVTILISLFLPGTSYLFIWPFLLSLLGSLILVLREKPSWIEKTIVLLLSFIPIISLWPSLIRQLFIILGLSSVGVLMLMVIFALGLLIPLLKLLTEIAKGLLPALTIGLMLLSVLVVNLGSGVADNQPGMNSIFYYQDLDQEQAYWVSIDQTLDEFTEQFFPAGYLEGELQELIPYEYVSIIKGAADVDVELPIEVNFVDQVIEDEVRKLLINIQVPQENASLIMHIEPDLVVDNVEVDGNLIDWEEHWPVLRYFNIPEVGIDLIVPTTIDSDFSISILGQLYGLPKDQGQVTIERPDFLIPAPTPITDTTIVSKTYHYQ